VSIDARLSHLCVPFSEKLDSLLDHRIIGARCMVLEMMHSSGCAGAKRMLVTVVARCFTGYKYLLHIALITISQSFFLSPLGFIFLALRSPSMGDKRGTKRARSPSKEGSPSLSGVKTPPPAPSGSPLSLKPLSEVFSRCPCSLVWEQGGSSMKVPVMDLSSSSDEENLIADVSRDEDFARRLFGDLNRDILGSSSDGKIIILSDSNKEEDVRGEKAIDAEATPPSTARSPAPTASAHDDDGTYKSNTPDRVTCDCSRDGDEAGLP
jgi:hypothetical protein